MSFARLQSIVAALAIVAAGLLGWAYSSERRKAQEAQAAAERERLRSQGLLVVDPKSYAQLNQDLENAKKENDLLKKEIERVAKEIPGAKVEGFFHVVVPGKVTGQGRQTTPAATTPQPHGSLAPAGAAPGRTLRFPPVLEGQARRPVAAPWRAPGRREPASLVRLVAAGTADVAATAGSPAPGTGRGGTGPATVGGAPRGAPLGGDAGEAKDLAGIGECVLAAGDDAEIVIDEARLGTEAGNTVVVGTAKMNRTAPPPQTTVFAAKFSAGNLGQVPCKEKAQGKGWGVGVYGTAWDGGGSVGPVLGLPSAMLFGHALDTAVMVGFGSKLQLGASAVARF